MIPKNFEIILHIFLAGCDGRVVENMRTSQQAPILCFVSGISNAAHLVTARVLFI